MSQVKPVYLIAAGLVLLVIVLAVWPDGLGWLLGGAGALVGARKLSGARVVAKEASASHMADIEVEEASRAARAAAQSDAVEDAATEALETSAPMTDDERAKRRTDLMR